MRNRAMMTSALTLIIIHIGVGAVVTSNPASEVTGSISGLVEGWSGCQRRQYMLPVGYWLTDYLKRLWAYSYWKGAKERFHSIPRDTTDKEQGGHVLVQNNRSFHSILIVKHDGSDVKWKLSRDSPFYFFSYFYHSVEIFVLITILWTSRLPPGRVQLWKGSQFSKDLGANGQSF